jgi:hypothetical protein
MKKTILPLLALAMFSAVVFIACKKDNSKSTTVIVKLTDNPIDAEEVNVDIQEVQVNFNEDTVHGWMSLDTESGIYNLLGLQNGVDTVLAIGTIPSDKVREIRFVLGPDNTIKVNGTVFPLTVPSGAESGLKIKVNRQFQTSIDSVLIDFDAALSVHDTGNGTYELRPVLQIK